MLKYLHLTILLLLAFTTTAQEDDKLHTDWPDQSEDVKVMKPGQLQLETGFSYTRFEEGKDAWIAHEMIRYGMLRKAELRFVVEDGKQRDAYIEETSQSVAPLALSIKYSLVEGKGLLPHITAVGYLKLPFTSHSKAQQGYWSPALIMAFENELSEKLKLEYNAGIRQNAFSSGYSWVGTAGLLYNLSKKLEVFGEYYAQYKPDGEPQHNIDAGIQYDFKKNMQLDLAAGSTIFYKERNSFVSIGFCYRLHG